MRTADRFAVIALLLLPAIASAQPASRYKIEVQSARVGFDPAAGQPAGAQAAAAPPYIVPVGSSRKYKGKINTPTRRVFAGFRNSG